MVHYLVQGDTGAQIKVTLSRQSSNDTLDLSDDTVVLKVRKEGESVNAFEVGGSVLSDAVNEVIFLPGTNLLNISPGTYYGEIEITYSNSTVESVYEIVTIYIREDY